MKSQTQPKRTRLVQYGGIPKQRSTEALGPIQGPLTVERLLAAIDPPRRDAARPHRRGPVAVTEAASRPYPPLTLDAFLKAIGAQP